MNLLKMASSYIDCFQPSYLVLFVTSQCNTKCSFREAFSLDFPNERHNLTLDVVSIYLHENSHEHSGLRSWVKKLIRPDNHEVHLLRPEWPETTVDVLDTDHFLSEMAQYRQAGDSKETRFLSPLFRGINSLFIESLGNLRNNDYNLLKILKNSRNFLKYINKGKCSCTWECAVSCNIICNSAFYPSLLKPTVHHFIAARKRKEG